MLEGSGGGADAGNSSQVAACGQTLVRFIVSKTTTTTTTKTEDKRERRVSSRNVRRDDIEKIKESWKDEAGTTPRLKVRSLVHGATLHRAKQSFCKEQFYEGKATRPGTRSAWNSDDMHGRERRLLNDFSGSILRVAPKSEKC